MRALGRLPGPLHGRLAPAEAAQWREVTKLLAWHAHALRTLLNLSQAEVAQRAGVSQGAISRLEAARCTDTPLVTYAKVAAAFCRELAPLRDKLAPDVRSVLDFIDRLLQADTTRTPLGVFDDPTLLRLIRVYEQLPPAARASYAEMLDTLGAWMLARVEGE